MALLGMWGGGLHACSLPACCSPSPPQFSVHVI